MDGISGSDLRYATQDTDLSVSGKVLFSLPLFHLGLLDPLGHLRYCAFLAFGLCLHRELSTMQMPLLQVLLQSSNGVVLCSTE